MSTKCHSSSSGSCSSWESTCVPGRRLESRQPACPSWVFTSSWYQHPQITKAYALAPISLCNSPVRDQAATAIHGLQLPGAANLSPDQPTISRFSAFYCLSCFDNCPVRVYSADAYSPWQAVPLTRSCPPLCTITAILPEPRKPVEPANYLRRLVP